MLRINTLIRLIAAVGLAAVAVVTAHYNPFSIFILQGNVFLIAIAIALVLQLPARWLAGFGCSLIAVSAALYLGNWADGADLVATVAFKILIIAVIGATIAFIRSPELAADQPT